MSQASVNTGCDAADGVGAGGDGTGRGTAGDDSIEQRTETSSSVHSIASLFTIGTGPIQKTPLMPPPELAILPFTVL